MRVVVLVVFLVIGIGGIGWLVCSVVVVCGDFFMIIG